MNRTDLPTDDAATAVETALRTVVPLFSDSTRLPAAGDLLRRARRREREVAAARLTRWHGRLHGLGLGLLALAAAGAAYATEPQWGSWLLRPLLERPPLPGTGDAAVLAGAVLAASAAIVWVAQQFADE